MKCLYCESKKYFFLFKKNGYQIVKCSNCNLVQLSSLPTQKSLQKYYQDFNYDIGFKNEKIIRKDAIRTLNNFLSLDYYKGSILDIGCGAGFFLDEARKYGWKVTGIDISKTVCSYARKKLKLDVINDDFDSYNFSSHHYDVITIIQLIEHLIDPQSMLIRSRSLLKKTGLLCITTPNINSYLSRITRENFNYIIPPEHVVFYSAKTISQILEKTGFQIIKIITWGYPSDLMSIIKYILRRRNNDNKSKKTIEYDTELLSFFKKTKSLIFHQLCNSLYNFLNIKHSGSMLEVYACKK